MYADKTISPFVLLSLKIAYLHISRLGALSTADIIKEFMFFV